MEDLRRVDLIQMLGLVFPSSAAAIQLRSLLCQNKVAWSKLNPLFPKFKDFSLCYIPVLSNRNTYMQRECMDFHFFVKLSFGELLIF